MKAVRLFIQRDIEAITLAPERFCTTTPKRATTQVSPEISYP